MFEFPEIVRAVTLSSEDDTTVIDNGDTLLLKNCNASSITELADRKKGTWRHVGHHSDETSLWRERWQIEFGLVCSQHDFAIWIPDWKR